MTTNTQDPSRTTGEGFLSGRCCAPADANRTTQRLPIEKAPFRFMSRRQARRQGIPVRERKRALGRVLGSVPLDDPRGLLRLWRDGAAVFGWTGDDPHRLLALFAAAGGLEGTRTVGIGRRRPDAPGFLPLLRWKDGVIDGPGAAGTHDAGVSSTQSRRIST